MFENITRSIQSIGRFSDKDIPVFLSKLKTVTVQKDDLLLKQGKVSQSLYFVNKGSFRQYSVADSGDEITLNLFIENDWMLEYKSFTSQKPSASIIQATEDSEVFELSVYAFHELIGISEVFFQVGRILGTGVQDDYNQRTSPKEKYACLLATRPGVIQKFPLKYIASYLNMTPETLSRVRKSIA
jgi:CRP-like cAMP-binding protein